eukprot:gene41076-50110_t
MNSTLLVLVLLVCLVAVSSFRRHISLPKPLRRTFSLNDYTECQPGEFDTLVLKSKTPVIVDFFAKWCPPCKHMTPIFKALSDEYTDEVKFVKVDADDFEDVCAEYQILGLPTFAVFIEGKMVATRAGAMPKEMLMDWIDESLSVLENDGEEEQKN